MTAANDGACDVRATLMYAGSIAGRARLDIPDPGRTNLAFEPVEVTLHDVRAAGALGLQDAGFQYVRHDSTVALSPELHEANLRQEKRPTGHSRLYQEELCEFLKALTGARRVFPQLGGLVVRTSHRAARKSWAAPAGLVHLDYTATSARQFLHWSAQDQGVRLPSSGRYLLLQTWRAVSPPPQDNSLCICDRRSADPADAVVFDTVLAREEEPGNFFEARLCGAARASEHRWYYLPGMTASNLLVFQGFDSEAPGQMSAMHSAFDNPLAGDTAPPRQSIEARFVALFD